MYCSMLVNIMFLVLIMLCIGLFSLMESILLASVQYRQGPMAMLGNGAGQAVADGIKLYSKYSNSVFTYGSGMGLMGVPLMVMTGTGMMLMSFGVLASMSMDVDVGVWMLISSVGGLYVLLPVIMAASSFVSMGAVSQLKAMMVGDMLLESMVLVLLTVTATPDTMANSCMKSGAIGAMVMMSAVPYLSASMMVSGKAPFDLPEAESELVSGSLTEVHGLVFSLLLLADLEESYFLLFIWLGLVISLSLLSYLCCMFMMMSLMFKMILVSMSLYDLPSFVFLMLLWPVGMLFLSIY